MNLLVFYSCNKNNDIVTKDENANTTDVKRIEENLFFPIDTTKLYIYKNTTRSFDDVGAGGWTSTSNYDTISFGSTCIYDSTEYRIFDRLKFTTTATTIAISANSNDTIAGDEKFIIAYTNITDTTWTYSIYRNNISINSIFKQTYNESTNEIIVVIEAADLINCLFQEYRFKKYVGIVYKASNGSNIETYFELIN